MSLSNALKLSSSTEVEVIKARYSWTIHNFSFLCGGKSKKVKSTVFAMGEYNEYEWCLRMYPHGCEDSPNSHVSLFLQLVSPTKSEIYAKFDFSVVKADGQKHTLASHKIRSYTQWKSLGYHELIERSQLLDERTGYMVDDTLQLLCDVSISTGNISSLDTAEKARTVRTDLKLISDLENLLSSKDFTDAVLLVGDHRFDVHKALLSARSPVFAAMFKHDMKEKRRSEVKILDIENEVMRELVRFLYTGRVERLDSVATGLLAAADKYALDDLKLICERFIYSNINVDNAVNTLVIADRHNSSTLKEEALKFMKANAIRMVDNFTKFLLNSMNRM